MQQTAGRDSLLVGPILIPRECSRLETRGDRKATSGWERDDRWRHLSLACTSTDPRERKEQERAGLVGSQPRRGEGRGGRSALFCCACHCDRRFRAAVRLADTASPAALPADRAPVGDAVSHSPASLLSSAMAQALAEQSQPWAAEQWPPKSAITRATRTGEQWGRGRQHSGSRSIRSHFGFLSVHPGACCRPHPASRWRALWFVPTRSTCADPRSSRGT